MVKKETLTLMNYEDKTKHFEIVPSIIGAIIIEIISGDEIATIIYEDYSIEKFYSDYANVGYHDGSYVLYKPTAGIDLLHDKRWLNRKNAYEPFEWVD